MIVKTTTVPKEKTAAALASDRGCCRGDVTSEPQNKNANPTNPATHDQPSKTAKTCCCGDAGTK